MKEKLQTRFSMRQYMISKDFEVYYYTDMYKKKVALHSHDYYEIFFFLEGAISLEMNDKILSLKHGDIVIIPPKIKHRAVIHDKNVPYRRFVFWISCDYLNHLIEISPSFGYINQIMPKNNGYLFHNDAIAFNTIQGKIFRLIEEINTNRYGQMAMISFCICDLLLHLNRTIYEQHHEKNTKEQQKLYESLVYYIEDHLNEDLSLDVLEQKFFVNKYYIAHVFKDNIGISLHQYVRKKRLEACKDAIRGGQKITEVYLFFGFKDYSSFYRAFKSEFGVSPKEYAESSKITPSKFDEKTLNSMKKRPNN